MNAFFEFLKSFKIHIASLFSWIAGRLYQSKIEEVKKLKKNIRQHEESKETIRQIYEARQKVLDRFNRIRAESYIYKLPKVSEHEFQIGENPTDLLRPERE
jgi:cell division protein FtsI/penicillin-binding protein 2